MRISLITLCASDPKGAGPTTLPAGPPPWLQFRAVVPPGSPDAATAESFVDPNDPSGKSKLLLSRQVLLDESALEDAGILPPSFNPSNRWTVTLSFRPDAGKALAQYTGENVGRRLGIVWDGKLIMAPRIRTVMSQHVMIDFGPNGSERECRELIDQIYAGLCTLR